jgi:MoxR-like ATPase
MSDRVDTVETACTPDQAREYGLALERAVQTSVIGQSEVVRQVIITLFAGGHALLEGVPGLGKTLLVRILAQAVHLTFSRIQFTPDLMPADCTGTNILAEDETGARTFRYQPGPLFANMILADEINRATPKTQSALLEAMQEHTVTVGDRTRPLPEPFFVLATQNPLEMEGTYPLPEAQLDRFLFKIHVPFPEREVLRAIARQSRQAPTAITPVLDARLLLAVQAVIRQMPVPSVAEDLAISLVLATHPERRDAPAPARRFLRAGASPRGLQALLAGAQVLALLSGRYNVAADDVRALALPVLRHRVLLSFEAQVDGISSDTVLSDVLAALG